MFIQSRDVSMETARLGMNVAAIGWVFFSPLFLWFCIILSGFRIQVNAAVFWFVFCILPGMFLYKQWTGCILFEIITTEYGWNFVWSRTIWTYAYFVYYVSLLGVSLTILWQTHRRASDMSKRIQAKIIFISLLVAAVLGSLSNVILPWIGFHRFPPMANNAGLIWHVSMVYAIVKYKLMSITPVTAAENIISTMSEALILIDKNGCMVTVNKAATVLLGYVKTDLEGKPLSFIFADTRAQSDFFQTLLSGKEFKDIDLEVVDRTNMRIPVVFSSSVLRDESNAIAGIVCLVMDMRDRKKAEEILKTAQTDLEKRVHERTIELQKLSATLAEESQKLEVTLSSIGDGVIATDIHGRVVLMNSSAEKITGWLQDEALKKPLSHVLKLVDERTGQLVADPVGQVLASGEILYLREHTALITKNERQVSIADSAAPIKGRDGRMRGVVLVFRDITEKRNMEKELLKTMKLESLGVLAGGIAHDFNNVLTGILTNLNLAKMRSRESSDIYQFLTDAEYASLRAKDLTHQLLTFAKGGAPLKEVFLLPSIVKDTAAFVLAGSKAKAEFSFAPDLWPVEVDVGQISQVVQNLLINAVEAMPEGGLIEIAAANYEVSGAIGFTLAEGQYVKMTIRDSGKGIASEELVNIFDPYFTTKTKGSGLGLATSYSIIKKHNGYICAESTVGVGTVFYVYLPATRMSRGEVKENPIEPRASFKARILAMDDEDIILQVMRNAFATTGCEVVCVGNGAEAVRMYAEYMRAGTPFDLVILDLVIPGGMGGKETFEELCRLDSSVKAIVSSGYSNDPVMAEFKKYGFKGVVEKPYSIDTLLQTVTNVLKQG